MYIYNVEKKDTKKTKGMVVIFPEKCKGCAFCIEFCPPRILEFSEKFNSKGYHYPINIKPEECTGCDLCGLFCPDFAIFGVRYKDLTKNGVDIRKTQTKKIK